MTGSETGRPPSNGNQGKLCLANRGLEKFNAAELEHTLEATHSGDCNENDIKTKADCSNADLDETTTLDVERNRLKRLDNLKCFPQLVTVSA